MAYSDMLCNTGLWHRVRVAAHGSFLVSVLAILASASTYAASTVTLAWDPSTGTNIAGYKIYYGASSRSYTNTLEVGDATTATISNLVTGATYYFVATAYDSYNLESDFSNEVTYTNTVLAPPTIALTSPVNGAVYTAPASIGLSASVAANGHSVTKVQFYNGATLLGEDANAPYALTWSSVPSGAYSLTARLVYDAGATLNSTPAVGIVVAAPKPENTPPTISPIADQTTPEGTGVGPISFTIGDAETSVSNLTVYAASGNPALLPTNNIIFGGEGSNLTVTLTPVAGATGTVAVTLYVSDGDLTTNTTFTLTVTPALTPVRLANNAMAANSTAPTSTASTLTMGCSTRMTPCAWTAPAPSPSH